MVTRKQYLFGWRDFILVALLFLASVHCVRSIFLVNVSLVDLQKYAQGTERMPFQGRVAMMPILHWAHNSHVMQRSAAFFQDSLVHTPHFAIPPEDVTPEKLASIVFGLLSVWLAVAFGIVLGRRQFGAWWWMPPAFFLFMLYVTYAARYEAQYWYPYDLPHIALYGIAATCILNGAFPLAFVFFLFDLPVRETSVFLVPLVLAVGYADRKRSSVGWASAMLLLWLPIRLIITHRFAGNPTDAGVHWLSIERALANPFHWPQVVSAFGFLFIPFCFGFHKLTDRERYFVYGSFPAIGITALYGIWYETRVWNEWLLPFAFLVTVQVIRHLRRSDVALVGDVDFR